MGLMTEEGVRQFFGMYAERFNRALGGDTDMEGIAGQYASEFIAASPAGVMTGKNDETLKQVMAQGYERYRQMGTKEMRIRSISVTPIDEQHGMARVAWTAVYAKDNQDIPIDFDVHYLLQEKDGTLKVFGWVSGDEQALLKQHGII